MREKAQKYLLEVMDDARRGPAARVVKCVLWVLSQTYRTAVWMRAWLYELGVFHRRSFGCLTISVGNITVGGTGKTPVVEVLGRALSERGRKVAILSRGYRSESKNVPRPPEAGEAHLPKVVSDGKRILLDSIAAGDEPYLLARNLRGAAVLVDRNRLRAGRYAISRMGVDTLILDDGFQHMAVGGRLDLVLIDCTNPFGNGHLLPRGILREPLSGLRRAHCFVLTKTGSVELEAIKGRLREINPAAEIVETVHQPLYFEEVRSGEQQPPEFIRGKDVCVLSGIARPESFERAIEGLGGRVRKRIRFVDHHRYSDNEIERIVAEARAENVDCIVTTQKDAVRVPPLESSPVPILFLRVEVKITRGAADFADLVSKICHI